MSHAYPIARTARTAITKAEHAARSRAQVEALDLKGILQGLETEWLTPASRDVARLLEQAEAGPGEGFLQHYEDAKGNTVLAVTYWKMVSRTPKLADKAPDDAPTTAQTAGDDHTDDLYFRHRGSKRRKSRPADPNQLDMFEKPRKPD
ncbi:MAG: hypothetical protein GYB42_04140 [Alphaproteobacteria bacterium]|nr:hypothetical protein [Alphaproteobacteria bacterium]